MTREWLLIRGLGREGEHSAEFIELLKKEDPSAEVRCIDLPGAGEFHRLSCPMTIDAMAEFVHSQIKHRRFDKRYIIAISLGAMVATALVRLYPEDADGMVLCNTSFKNLSPLQHRLQLKAFRHLYKAARAKNSEDRERAILSMVNNRPDRDTYIQPWARIAEQRPVAPANFLKQLFAAARYRLPKDKPDMPILVLSSATDRMVSPACSLKFAEYWNLPIYTHPEAGHEIWLDAGPWVVEKIKSFFKVA